jgi:hypothetical protein
MPDVKRYWQEVRTIERSLPKFVWMVSIEDSLRGRAGGSLAEVSAAAAAPLLHAKTHRVAAEDEVRGYRTGEENVKKAENERRLRRRGVAVVTVGGDGETGSPA